MINANFNLTINTRRYCTSLLLIALGLVAIHTMLYIYNYQVEEAPWLLLQLFDLDEENNLPTWFSSFLLLNNAFILYVFAGSVSGRYRSHWFLLSAGFLILAVDEVAGLHESFNSAIEMNWAIFGGALVLVVALVFTPFMLSLERRLAALFVASGFIFISGAIIVELLAEDMVNDSLAYTFSTALEEGLEMMGALLFLYVNLKNMRNEKEIEMNVNIS